MNTKVHILTLSKDIDNELLNTTRSLVLSAKDSDTKILQNMAINTFLLILLVIANFINLYLTHFKTKKK